MTSFQRKRFFEAWIEDAKDDYREEGAKALIPPTAAACASIGSLIAILAPHEAFFRKPDLSLVFLTAILTFNGLLLTLSWNGFAKIYEIASRPNFSAFLRREGMIADYFFHVDFIHFSQIVAVVSTAFAMGVAILDRPPILLLQVSTAICIAATAYGLTTALGAIGMMQDLVYYSAIFDEEFDKEAQGVRRNRGDRQIH